MAIKKQVTNLNKNLATMTKNEILEARAKLVELLAAQDNGTRERLLVECTSTATGEQAYNDYLAVTEFLDRALDELDPKAVAALQYICAKHRVYCAQMPDYADFMPRMYNNAEDISNPAEWALK